MTTQILIAALCTVAGTMLGLVFSKRLAERDEYYKSLLALVDILISEVSFRKNTAKNIISEFSKACNSTLSANLNEYLAANDLKSLTFSKGVLSGLEVLEVKNFLSSFGTLDTSTQLSELENYKSAFKKKSAEAEELRKKMGSVYIKLGFFAGLAVGIILL